MDREKLKEQLQYDEGLKLKPYHDTVGKLTIGFGRNLDDKGISTTEAEIMLSNDIIDVEKELDEHLPWWRKLDEVRQFVLANMCFNMGIGNDKHGLLSFKDTLQHIHDGYYSEAVKHMIQSLWHEQVGIRAERLEKMLLTGEWL